MAWLVARSMLHFSFVLCILREVSSEMHEEHQPPWTVNCAARAVFPSHVRTIRHECARHHAHGGARLGVVTIEGASTLTDAPEASVNRALDEAIARCLKTAES